MTAEKTGGERHPNFAPAKVRRFKKRMINEISVRGLHARDLDRLTDASTDGRHMNRFGAAPDDDLERD